MSRPNKIQSQLEAALRDAENATGADISVQKLIQTRLTILNKMAGRQHGAKIRKLKDAVNNLNAENEHIKAEVMTARMEIQRLQNVRSQGGASPFGASLDEKLKAVEVEYQKREEENNESKNLV